MSRPPHFAAGDFWRFAEHDAPGGQAIGVWGLFAEAMTLAEAVLAGVGIQRTDLLGARPLHALRDGLTQGSVEDVALAVYAKARLARAMLSGALPSGQRTLQSVRLLESARLAAPDEWEGDKLEAAWVADHEARTNNGLAIAAGAVADFAMTYAVLQSMAGDLTGQAATGRQASRQRREAAKKAADVQANHSWRAVADELWTEDPARTVNSVALEIVRRFTTDRKAPEKSSVMRSIRPLIPPTSPSFKGG